MVSRGRTSSIGLELPSDTEEILRRLVLGLPQALKGNLVGLYLRGSLATGDFSSATSDLDLLAVTEQPVSKAEFAALAALHAELAGSSNPYANRIEIAYVDRGALEKYEPGLRHPTLYEGEALRWEEHRTNWILERWSLREQGVALLGPDPEALIEPVSRRQVREAVIARLQDWADWANQPDDPDWSLPLAHKRYVVETMCRALHTLACGELAGKHHAAEWASVNLPAPWRSTVERSRAWQGDASPSAEIVKDVRQFVLWAAADGVHWADNLQDAVGDPSGCARM